jgi:putative endonuclease
MEDMKKYYVYMITSQMNGTLYIGVTNDLIRRIWEHKMSLVKGFSSKYRVNKLVYYEEFEEIILAIKHEKKLKECPRQWKIDLIKKKNPTWTDLYLEIAS